MDRRNDQNTSRNKAPIADLHKSKDIFDKCLSSPVTLTVGELCGVSVEIRNHFRDSTSPKRLVNINNTEIAAMAQSKIESETEGHFGYDFETDYFHHLEQAPPSNPYEMYHQSLTNEPIADDVQVAKEADAICTIKANLNNFGEVDCIVDSGSQVVAISESMAVKFGLTWDPRITLKMVKLTTKSSIIPDTSIPACSTDPLAESTPIPYSRPQPGISPSKIPCPVSSQVFTKESMPYLYLHVGSASKISIPQSETITSYSTYIAETQPKIKRVQVKKKYKPVALRTKPVAASIPDGF
ncbi:hypothetical protein C0991_002503 [Blastosporella zonata]|nr:hypothetical protein C0991_002503 [Blastosporella zonata]